MTDFNPYAGKTDHDGANNKTGQNMMPSGGLGGISYHHEKILTSNERKQNR
jgi:hypothetical protein